jgi:hypothetical protein
MVVFYLRIKLLAFLTKGQHMILNAAASAVAGGGVQGSESATIDNKTRVPTVQPAPVQTQVADRCRQQSVKIKSEIRSGVDNETVTSVIVGLGFPRDKASLASAVLFEEQRNTPDKVFELSTLADLCKHAKVSPTTVWRDKDIPFVIVGQRKRYCLPEVMAYFAAKAQGRRKTGKHVGKKGTTVKAEVLP